MAFTPGGKTVSVVWYPVSPGNAYLTRHRPLTTMLEAAVNYLESLPSWQATVVVIVVSLAGAVLIELVGMRVVRRLVRRTDSKFDNILYQEVRWPAVITVALAGVFVLTQTPDSVPVAAQQEFDQFFGKPAASVIVLLWAYALNRIVNRSVNELKGGRFEFAPVFSNVFTLVVIAGSIFMVLSIWGVEITPLLGAAGVAGIAVGFAAKDAVANFFGGMALYFDDTYKIGDFVVLDSGQAGTVVDVGVRSTTLMTRDEVLVTVPNSVLNNAKITNESAPEQRKRIRVPVGVAYGTDLDEFEEIVVGIAEDNGRVLDSPRPRMRFRTFGDSALNYELLCWVRNPLQDAKTTHQLNREIYQTLDDAGIEIPYPKRDVSMAGPDGDEPASRDLEPLPSDSADGRDGDPTEREGDEETAEPAGDGEATGTAPGTADGDGDR